MKLNVGAGDRRWPGYTGVDAVARAGVDIVAEAHAIPLADGCAEEVAGIHLIEHLLPWTVPAALKEWHRLLAPGGLLVLEQPDLIKCCRNILSGRAGKHPDQLGRWGLYGDPRQEDPYMLHRWGYTFATLAPMVLDAGFVQVGEHPTRYHLAGRDHRDFRIEARKP